MIPSILLVLEDGLPPTTDIGLIVNSRSVSNKIWRDENEQKHHHVPFLLMFQMNYEESKIRVQLSMISKANEWTSAYNSQCDSIKGCMELKAWSRKLWGWISKEQQEAEGRPKR